MKIIKYNLLTKANHGTKENPQWCETFNAVELEYSESNLEIAKKEAYNGEYTIEDDGKEAAPPTTEERLAALESAMLEMLGVSE